MSKVLRDIDTRSNFNQSVHTSALGTRHDGQAQQSTTAIIIEKRPLIRDLLSRCLTWASGFDVVAVATVEEGLKYAPSIDPRVVLLSVIGSSQSDDNQQLVERATQAFGGTAVVVLSDVEELQQVVDALKAGSRGYISTSMSLDVAVEALRLVRAGGQFLPANCVVGPGSAATVDAAPVVEERRTTVQGLFTARQAAVVEALRRGKANKIIAYELNMRESTVKVHVRNIMKRLKARNRTEVAYIINQLVNGNKVACEAGDL
ncbi:HTH luxR-type domain-containing protein [Hyphomicrobium sp. 1Nfss2.1]|uniref:LuxR C-terminal-related transcriptional regulator n=1 Tax=Hyphomicrobium sp. 1Nfss2.1 TaxID=3413936 RepID=UPI003C797840